MAKVDSLKDGTDTVIYPKTISSAVYDEDTNKTVKASLEEIKVTLGTTVPTSGWWFKEI